MGRHLFLDVNFIDAGVTGAMFIRILPTQLSMLGYTIAEQLNIAEVQESLVKCYRVKAEIKDAKTQKGYRAAVFKMAEQHHGIYNPWDQSQTINYASDGDDLKIALLFKEETDALTFRTSLSHWHLNNPLVVQPGAISVAKGLLVETYVDRSNLNHVMLSDYLGADSDYPVQNLNAFQGLPSSRSGISVVSRSDPLALFQSIEKPEVFTNCKPYKMHLKSQFKYPKLASDSNNMLAGSWTPLYQFFDGLCTVEEMPMVAIEPLTETNFQEVNVGLPPEKRYKVDLHIEFRNESCALEMESRFKDGSTQISATIWRSFVHVTDPVIFCKYLKFKCDKTKKKWCKCDVE